MDTEVITVEPSKKLNLPCTVENRGSPKGSIFWECPRKQHVDAMRNRNPRVQLNRTDFSLNWDLITRRDRGFYR